MTDDRGAPRLTIVVPAYNEAERIGPALDELFGWLRRGGPARSNGRSSDDIGAWDVLVVDDGSSDDTVDIVEARPEAQPGADGSPPRLRVLRRRHAGKGAAVTAGVLAADGDLVVFTDADMATPPDQIPLLTEALATADVALGSRIQPDGSDRRASHSPPTGAGSGASIARSPVPGSPVTCPTRSVASRASAEPRPRTSSAGSRPTASSSTSRSST